MNRFVLESDYEPRGDQPGAIDALTEGIGVGKRHQVLLGVTGSGKTYTMASVIQRVQRPALVIAHNKTLAAQLCAEFRSFFPSSAVEYFVSYYDYYQPEAYIASTDSYIEKETSVNEEIDRLRHSATAALKERRDVIIVASVSCIYAMGNPADYEGLTVSLRPGMMMSRDALMLKLVDIQYTRNEIDFARGTFRARGDVLEIIPPSSFDRALRIEFFGDEIERVSQIDVVSGHVSAVMSHALLFPATHYAADREAMERGVEDIERDLAERLEALNSENRLIEAQRLSQRTRYDIEMMREIGYCSGIENYSRYFDGRVPGEAPFTLLSYFPDDYIVFVDESHVTIPQIRAMYRGDRARKEALVEYGFRLPAAFDNRPLLFEEFERFTHRLIYVSATPGLYETEHAQTVAEQIIRPTGLIDPQIIVRPAAGQVDDLVAEIHAAADKGARVLVTTLTKRMAESLADYLKQLDIRVRYLHSDIQTMERAELIRDLRLGEYDVLVGINLLREGLDIPEVALVAILDADKEGFLRSGTSLVQTIGRAARNIDGRVIMYADMMTDSMMRAIGETNRRRALQQAYNEQHGITPQSVKSAVRALIEISRKVGEVPADTLPPDEREGLLQKMEDQMLTAAQALDFEQAAKLRDKIFQLRGDTPGKAKEQPKASKRRNRARR